MGVPRLETVQWALGVYAGLLLFLIGLRATLVWRRTGRNPFPVLARVRPSIEILGLLGLVVWVALVLRYALEGPFGPFAMDFAVGVLRQIGLPMASGPRDLYLAMHWSGVVVIATAGTTFAAAIAQLGESWRIGIDRDQTEKLVTRGIYSLVRHPIYTGLQLGSAGVFLLAPTWVFLVSVPLLIAGTRRQALAEEAWLLERFPEEYRTYARRTGRFLPGIGRLR